MARSCPFLAWMARMMMLVGSVLMYCPGGGAVLWQAMYRLGLEVNKDPDCTFVRCPLQENKVRRAKIGLMAQSVAPWPRF